MAHKLWPADGAPFLSIDEILARWQEAFAHVRADPAAGRAGMDTSIAYLERMVGRNKYFTPEHLERARRHRDQAVRVYLANVARPGRAYLDTVLEPETEIFFGYVDGHHEDAAAPLVARAAEALGYRVELV